MGFYNVVSPGSLQSGQPEDISVVLANFQAIQAILNGGLDNSNLASGAAIAASKISGYPADGTKGLQGDGLWRAILQSDLPANLGNYPAGSGGYLNYVSDLNLCTQVGWYAWSNTTLNRPFDGYGVCETLPLFDTSNVRQVVWQYNSDNQWTRRKQDGGAWGPWRIVGGLRWVGPFDIASGSVPSGGYVNVGYTHNLGVAPDFWCGYLTDVSWGMNLTWIVSNNAPNSINVYLANHSDIGGGTGSSTNAATLHLMGGYKGV